MNVITTTFSMLWATCKNLIYPIAIIVGVIFLMYCLNLFYYIVIKKIKLKKGKHQRQKRKSILKRLFIEFPNRLAIDRINKDPDFFNAYGVHVFCGEQGSGKTVSMTQFIRKFQKEYPRLKVATNYNYKYEDSIINSWEDMVSAENGIYGYINSIDEIQTWFNSTSSKNFPPEMLAEICMQRKQKKILVGTAQVFGRIAKPIREQINFVYKPITVAGALTIVRIYKPKVSSNDGQLDDLKLRGMYFFVHSKEIRDAFDTYEKVKKMSKDGFLPRSEQIHNNYTLLTNDVDESK